MTADHWITVAIGTINVIAVVVGAILTPVIASRISQPKQQVERSEPNKMKLYVRVLVSPWVLPVGLVVINICGLLIAMQKIPLTPFRVVRIAFYVAAIMFAVIANFMMRILRLVGLMIDHHFTLRRDVREFAEEMEKRGSTQTLTSAAPTQKAPLLPTSID